MSSVVTCHQARYAVLDGWRGLAILLVLVGHFLPLPGSEVARLGVELFFVLSGRLMAEVLVERQTSLKRFFWRRATRVVPALFVFLALVAIAAPWMGRDLSALEVGAVATFWSNYLFTFFPREPLLGHTWSLSIEEHSYIALALLVYILRRNRNRVAWVVLIAAGVGMARGLWLTVQDASDYYETYWRTDVRAASVFLGFALYLLFNKKIGGTVAARVLNRRGATALILGMLLCLFTSPVPDPLKYSVGSVSIAVLLVLVQAAHRAGKSSFLTRALTARWLGKLGAWSFSIYLYQQIFHVVKASFPSYTYPMFLLLALVVGWAGHRVIELPAQRRLNAAFDSRDWLILGKAAARVST